MKASGRISAVPRVIAPKKSDPEEGAVEPAQGGIGKPVIFGIILAVLGVVAYFLFAK